MPDLAIQTTMTSKPVNQVADIQSDTAASRKQRLQDLAERLAISLNRVTKDNQLNTQAHLHESARIKQLKDQIKSLEHEKGALQKEVEQLRLKTTVKSTTPEYNGIPNKPFLEKRGKLHGSNPHTSFQPAAQPAPETINQTPSPYRRASK